MSLNYDKLNYEIKSHNYDNLILRVNIDVEIIKS